MGEQVPEELTEEERERLERSEQEALAILNRQVREGRWYPRRHMHLAFFIIAGLVALYFLVAWLLRLVEQLELRG
jgi:hypothetical protein